ncbi:hypothetical protein BCR44DRAFT_1434025 [Catenaria anguillulae PL171]|uniref:PSP proline-rich domain-containing protein n=1 Tax=Catenaria anguillulae PL171 TaxID=765915 RepID=A0A1Y2HM92_9FUNG|nr:hypothetical protein BCR44DRAFT_1434025 [Catenaria anguillulae PL171]
MADADDVANGGDQGDGHGSDSDSSSDNEDGDGNEMSNRKLRRAARLTVAELKQLVDKPEVVEWVDVTAPDPKLLIDIKSTRNTIPVPQHWAQKRKYLQNKRGLEKSAFKLPDFILATGILEMRESLDKDGTKLKQKTRERVQPKMGKLVIDYAKLHAAFFKWQTKPDLTSFGDVYFEGKEFEAKLKHVRPGAPLSDALKQALGMPEGGGAPPPFLFNMQRYGPPPSYPGLKIPGLNAPLPPGCMWGFHPGGWGKPPVDEYGRPLYGDVYGHAYDPMVAYREAANAWRGGLWGEMERRADDSDSDEDMDQDSDDDDEIASEEDEPMELDHAGSGQAPQMPPREEAITSFGAEDEEMEMELQEYVAGLMAPPNAAGAGPDPSLSATNAAYAAGYTTETPLPPRELYTVVGESASRSAAARGTMMGSDVVYDIRRRQAPGTETETPMTGAGGSADEQAKRRQREQQRERERERQLQQQQASGTQSSRGGAGQSASSGRQRREFKF